MFNGQSPLGGNPNRMWVLSDGHVAHCRGSHIAEHGRTYTGGWRYVMFLHAVILYMVLAPSQKLVQVVQKDAIPAIDDPKFVSAEEGDKFLSNNELVIGLFDGETAKAYSAWILDGHEIVNDRLGDIPVAVTW